MHEWYPISKEEALTLDKGDFYNIVRKMRSISKKLLLCVHCEDPDVFRFIEKEIMAGGYDEYDLATYDKVRPPFVETLTMGDTMYLNHVLDGNVYMVHTASKDSIDVYKRQVQRIIVDVVKVADIVKCSDYKCGICNGYRFALNILDGLNTAVLTCHKRQCTCRVAGIAYDNSINVICRHLKRIYPAAKSKVCSSGNHRCRNITAILIPHNLNVKSRRLKISFFQCNYSLS